MPSVRAGIKSIKWTQPHPAGFSALWLPEAQGYGWVPFCPSVPTGLCLIAAPKACEKRQVTQALEAWLSMQAAGGTDPSAAHSPRAASPWLQQRTRPPAWQWDRASRWAPGVQMLSLGSPVRGCWPGSRSRLSDLTSSAYN